MSLVGPTFGPETYRSSGGSRRVSREDQAPAQPAGPAVSGSTNDQTQKLIAVGNGVFALDGKATNRGFAGSQLTMDVDGKRVSVSMTGGQSPKKTADLLEKALPRGYALERLESPAQFPGSVRFRIVKGDAAPAQKSTPADDAPAPRRSRSSDDDGGYGGFGSYGRGGIAGGSCMLPGFGGR